ncbi:hypothetical protein ABIF68_009168 [Bradyrhizobium japonicum]
MMDAIDILYEAGFRTLEATSAAEAIAKSWPRLFGQRPAGFKWIPAGLC